MFHARNILTLTRNEKVRAPDMRKVVVTRADCVRGVNNIWIVKGKEKYTQEEWNKVFPLADISCISSSDTSMEGSKYFSEVIGYHFYQSSEKIIHASVKPVG